MPTITVLSWNCCGGDLTELDTFISKNAPDIVALQEAPSTIMSSVLATNQLGALGPYMPATCDEFPKTGIQRTGGLLSLSGMKLNFIMVKRATLTLGSFALLDYTTDAN